MANDPRLAFVAIRATGIPFDPYEALLVGTSDAEGKDWGYFLCSTKDLPRRLKSGHPFLNPSINRTDLTADELRETVDTFAEADHGKEWLDSTLALATAIPFRNVVACAFFRNTGEAPPSEFKNPWVRLDTCGLDMPASGPESVGSTIFVAPRFIPGPTGLRAVWGNLQVRMALSGHVKRSGAFPADDPARFDPRYVLRFVAIDNAADSHGPPRSMWRPRIPIELPTPDGPKQVTLARGAQFDLLKSGLTKRSWTTGREDQSRQFGSVKREDLFGLTPHVQKPPSFNDNPEFFPAFEDLQRAGLLEPGTTGTPIAVKRQWCFRILDAERSNHPTRLGLRVEQEIELGDKAERMFDLVMPAPVASAPINKLLFAQEQRVGDLQTLLDLDVQDPEIHLSATNWILTVSPTAGGFDGYALVLPKFEQARDAVQHSLRTVRDAAPFSTLPRLIPIESKNDRRWQIVGQVVESEPWRRRTAFDPTATDLTGAARVTRIASFEPCLGKDLMTASPAPVPATRAIGVMRGIVTTERLRPVYDFDISGPTFNAPDSAIEVPGVSFFQPAISGHDDLSVVDVGTRFRLVPVTFRGAVAPGLDTRKDIEKALGQLPADFIAKVDIDALRFRLTKLSSSGPFLALNVGFVLIRSVGDRTPSQEIDVGLDAVFSLPADRVDPAGQDDPPGADRVTALQRRGKVVEPPGADQFAPLMFPLGDDPESASKKAYLLTAFETVTRKRNHTVSLSLRAIKTQSAPEGTAEHGAAEAGRLVLVIDPRPFRVVAVEYVDPADTASDESFEVAVRNAAGEGGLSWRVRDTSETVRLLLPPQVIGEAMEKNREESTSPSDVRPDRAAAARFGTPTRMAIDPTFFDTTFREPGWNLRRILGFAGQRAPGSRLRDLRLELLYGLTARVTPEDISVSELAGIIGAPALPLLDVAERREPAQKRQLTLINTVISAEQSRIAVDKLWRNRPDADLTLEDHVRFRLRDRLLDKDGKVLGGPTTHLRWPVPGGLPSGDDTGGLIDEGVLRQTFLAEPAPSDSTSFPGGAAWAFESANILMSVYGRPDSDAGGRLQDVYLSALGGYAGQRALFDEKKTVIETETKQGRVHRYRLERIGRIGGLWHRAKHVIIYERSVVPSAQFYNQPPIGRQQDELAGRPVLRKVEEFVELIQPRRAYPEDGTSLSAAGCLIGAEFKSTKIRVDSRWGSDVRREGWKVPLWNTAFASLKPEGNNPDDPSLIYPKPQIQLQVAGENGSPIGLEVAEPEKLVFYTSVVRGESADNTDLWRPVRDVDFVDLPLPVAGKIDPVSSDLTDVMLPPEPAHVPGYEQLTIGVVRSASGVAIAHGRQEGGPIAILKNLTIARALASSTTGRVPREAVDVGTQLANLGAELRIEIDRVAGSLVGVVDRVDRLLDPAAFQREAEARVLEATGALKKNTLQAVNRLKEQLNIAASKGLVSTQACQRVEAALREQIDSQARRFEQIAIQVVADAKTALDTPLRTLESELSVLATITDPTELKKRAEEFVAKAVLARAKGTVDELIRSIEHVETSVRATSAGLAGVVGAALDDATARVRDELRDLQQKAATVPGAIAASSTFEKAKEEAQKLQDQIRQFRSALNRIGSDGIPEPVRRILTAVNDAAGALSNAVTAAIKEAAGNIQKLAQLAQKLLDDFKGVTQTIEARLETFADGGTAAVRAVLAEIDAILRSVTEPVRAVLKAIAGQLEPIVINPDAPFPELKNAVEQASKAATAILTSARATLAKAESSATGAAARVIADSTGVLKAFVAEAIATCQQIEGRLTQVLASANEIDQWVERNLTFVDELERELLAAIRQTAASIAEIRRRVEAAAADVTRNVESRARQLTGAVQSAIRDTFGADPKELTDQAVRLYQQGDRTLRLIRAVGDPPKTDQLGFNRPEVAYVLNELNKVVDMTPALALVNRAADTIAAADQAGRAIGDLLQGFGIRLPMSSIGDQLLPDQLRGLSVADLLPDMAGIDFRGLLRRAGFPAFSDNAKAIRVRHGFDAIERRAWLEASVDVPFAEALTLLEFGPVRIVIDSGRFVSAARFAAGRDGQQRSISGRISGDWRVVTGGQTMLTFHQTGLFFDESGQLRFDIQPDKVELAAALQFLTNLVRATGKKGELVVEPFIRGGIPAGVAATLDMEVPPLQLGVFGISDLSLHVLFGIAALPQFEIVSELSVATRTAPFTLNVWILNGGGYLTQRLSFLPVAKPKPVLTYTLDVGIVAGVGVGFSFGVVSGGVWLQVGCSIAITWTTGAGGNTTAITVFILARGNVDVAGLITASISLLLGVTYDGASMVGSGTLSISVKISVFFTLSIQQHVQYLFAGEKRSSNEYAEAHG